jgi:mannose-6-phosphate isomerase-like protein (cupin superfamily)
MNEREIGIEEIRHENKLLAVIIYSNFNSEGIKFFTPDSFSQQLAFMRHPKGKVIAPHIHNLVKREVQYTQEVLIIRRGTLRVDFYDDNRAYLKSKMLNSGDLILLANGGHGFEACEDLEMFEVKQGPYAGEMDKIRFSPVAEEQIRICED